MRWPRSTDIFVSREALIAFAWSAPMRELAAKVGISDVGLKKILRASGIATPPQGHWNRVHAGRKVAFPPAAPARGPGETGRVRLDERFRGLVEEAGPMPAEGPFASDAVPEDLGALRRQELAGIGRVAVPRSLDRPHRGLLKLLGREEQARQKALADRWAWSEPAFDTPLGQRQLKLLNALFFALERRGCTGEAWEEDGELKGRARIGDTGLTLSFSMVGRFRTELRNGRHRPARDLPASTPLQLAVGRRFRSEVTSSWKDDEEGKLESRAGEIAAELVVAGEASLRQGLVEAVERAEDHRRWEEEQRQKRLAEAEARRIEALRESGRLLSEANEIRALVERVKQAVLAGEHGLAASDLRRWQDWALGYANRIDPVSSGQVLTHLLVPAEEEDSTGP